MADDSISDEFRRVGDVGEDLRRLEAGGAGESAIEMGAHDVEAPEGEIAEIRIQRGLWMTREEARLDAGALRLLAHARRHGP